MNNQIKIAVLDMNNNAVNQGLKNIVEICEEFKHHTNNKVSVEVFDIRHRFEIPSVDAYDIFISSGGPGSPHPEGHPWEEPYYKLLDNIWLHNKTSKLKKYLFLICHSFQIAVIHWELALVNKRKSYSFGVMPVHKTELGKKEFLFKNLPDPLFAVDSRSFQCIQPSQVVFKEMGAKILALEKIRPMVDLERAVMAIRFSKEIFGTQFHPEANASGLLASMKNKDYRDSLIQNFGIEKFLQTLDRIDDEDKIILTQAQILPRFLKQSCRKIINQRKKTEKEKV